MEKKSRTSVLILTNENWLEVEQVCKTDRQSDFHSNKEALSSAFSYIGSKQKTGSNLLNKTATTIYLRGNRLATNPFQ